MAPRPDLFRVSNLHPESCGTPPSIDGDAAAHLYHSYFEGKHGEQHIFRYDYQAETGELFSGAAGWQRTYPVVEGCAVGLDLDAPEALWLASCWAVVTGQHPQMVLARRDELT